MASEQPQPDGHGDQGHRDGGQELEDERREECHFERGHRGRAVLVGDVTDGGHLRLGPPEDLEGREAGHDVEEVSGQALEQPHLALPS